MAKYTQNRARRWIDAHGLYVSSQRIEDWQKGVRKRKRAKAAAKRQEARTRTTREKQSRAQKERWNRIRAIERAFEVDTKEAMHIDRESFAGKVRRRWQIKILDRFERVGPDVNTWRDRFSGRFVSPKKIVDLKQREQYWATVYHVAAAQNVSIAEARTIIKERYKGNWRDALADPKLIWSPKFRTTDEPEVDEHEGIIRVIVARVSTGWRIEVYRDDWFIAKRDTKKKPSLRYLSKFIRSLDIDFDLDDVEWR